MTEALASRTGSPTHKLLPLNIQVVACVAHSRADGDKAWGTARDAAVVAEVEVFKEIAAAAGKTAEKEETSLF